MSPEQLQFYRELHAQCQASGLFQVPYAFAISLLFFAALGWIMYRIVWPDQSMWFWKSASWLNRGLWVLALVGSCAFAYLNYLVHDAAVCFEIRDGLNL